MKNELRCEVVQDLLPTYIDGLTSEGTSQMMKEHFSQCESCSKMLEHMKSGEEEMEIEQVSIDFLKKTQKKQKRTIAVSGAIIIVVIFVLLFVKNYVLGKNVTFQQVNYDDIRIVEGNIVILNGSLKDNTKGVAKISFEEDDGVVNICMEESQKSSFHTNWFYKQFKAKNTVKQVRFGERVLWDEGEPIEEKAAAVYEAKHLYLGSMPENGKTIEALGVGKDMGDFLNELQTSKEPYGWKLCAKENYKKENKEIIERKITAYACAMIATIDNLGYVTYEYDLEGEQQEFTVTKEQADRIIGKSVKELAKTPKGTQELLRRVNLIAGIVNE